MLWRGHDNHAEYLDFDLKWSNSTFKNLDELLDGVEKEAIEECSASRAIEIIEMYSV